MAAWNPPSDADLGVGKPGKPSHVRAIRDLSTALAERAPGSPWLNGSDTTEIIRGFGQATESLAGEWTVPDGVYRIEVTLIGGGGAGGDGIGQGNILDGAGCGGGAGALVRRVLDVVPAQRFPVTIGAGGDPSGVDPSVDTSLDVWEQGDGARTTFGPIAAAGGKRGRSGGWVLGVPGGGVGGGAINGEAPTIAGENGGEPFMHIYRSGRGAGTVFGGGTPGRSFPGVGHSARVATHQGDIGVPGAGGGGGCPESGTDYNGGRGANGVVIVRY